MIKKGFTLTELLIVILVIGVLAAVAVPGYQAAVDKSRWAAMLPSAKALKDAQERVFMADGAYALSVSDLDVQVPGVKSTDKITNGNEQYRLANASSDSAARNAVSAQNAKLPANTMVMYLAQSPNFAGDLHCEALTADKRANNLCKSQGGTEIGTRDQYTVYLLAGSGEGKLSSWPKTVACEKYAANDNCVRHANEDGSWNEEYDKNGTHYDYYFDKDGKRYYASQANSSANTFSEAWWGEDGVMTKQTKKLADGTESEWRYDEKGNLNFFEATRDGALVQKVFYDENGKKAESQWYYANGNVQQDATFDPASGQQTSTTYYWSSDPGKVQYYNQYENGQYVAQTKYWPDGSVRGYYTTTDGHENGKIATEYNNDGTLRRSEDYTTPGRSQTIYFYNPDGTYIAKPNVNPNLGEGTPNTDASTWVYGTYTVGDKGDVTRSDGVTVPGSGNFGKLCTDHPEMSQCS